MGVANSFLSSISDFDSFKDRAEGIGLQALQCTPYHWQLKGGVNIVNYYPTKGTIHINGAGHKTSGNAEKALELARKSRTVASPTINKSSYRPVSMPTVAPKPVLKRQYSATPSPRVGTAW